MGVADAITKEYMRGSKVFADAFNYFIYGGEQVVDPEFLHELDTTEIAIPFTLDGKSTREEAVQKYRDVLKSTVVMRDVRASYILLGIENQTDIHYAMPVRNIIYDALQYGKQVSEIAKRHKDQKDRKGHNRGEYLSGFYKEDRISPVITLVVHFGAEEWDGPLSLYEMMELEDPTLKEFVQDYRIYLIDPYRLTEEDLEKFSSNLKGVLGYIKYSKDKKELSRFLNNSQMQNMDNDAARVIRDITKTPIYIPEGKGEINVCEAVKDMINESRLEGRAEGRAEGKAEGRVEGKAEGKIQMLKELVKDGTLSVVNAAAKVNMTAEQFKKELDKEV